MDLLINLDHNDSVGLQLQIRQKLVEAILSGVLPAGHKMISSRRLAKQLNVARNTVVLAFNKLVDEGYLVSRERSGLFVNSQILDGRIGFDSDYVEPHQQQLRWNKKIKSSGIGTQEFRCPGDWQNYPHPFIDGYFDFSLYPVAQWQEASRLAFGGLQAVQLDSDNDTDDAMLVEQIRTKILPRRGINALKEEVLITSGSHHSLYLLTQLLCDKNTQAAMEDPGSPALRSCLELTHCQIKAQAIDEQGLIIDPSLAKSDLIFITPSHQQPTAVTMPLKRRKQLLEMAHCNDQIIIEDDSESEHNYLGEPTPALRSLDDNNQVIYVSSLPKAIAPGLGLGFIIASPTLIKEARRLRRLMVGNPPRSNQRSAAFFISLGHYDAFMMRIDRIFSQRWNALRDALNHYLPKSIITIPNQGGTAFWVKCPTKIPVNELVESAQKQGILIEPVNDYYADPNYFENNNESQCFRMGVTSISQNKIRSGVAQLAKLIREFSDNTTVMLEQSRNKPLTEKQLYQQLSGTTFKCQTVYGAPCFIELLADGTMHGRAGHENEETDSGRWWIEDGRWFRKWQQWAYAESVGYYVTINEGEINWYNLEGRLVDTATIQQTNQNSKLV